MHQSSILATIPGKDMTFVQPIGSSNDVSFEDLNEWIAQDNALAHWNYLFFLAKMANSESVEPQKLKPMEDFSIKTAIHKTPAKKSNLRRMIQLVFHPSQSQQRRSLWIYTNWKRVNLVTKLWITCRKWKIN